MIKGIQVTLISKGKVGTDAFGNDLFGETRTVVEDVLVSPSSTDDVIDSTNLYGKKAIYTIAIPKGDTHEWTDNDVEFFNEKWHIFSLPKAGIEENIPLRWNAKYYVERFGKKLQK